jgi:hypothetical protein
MVVETTQDISYVISDLNARIRILESKYSLFGERLLTINKNMIDEYRKLIKLIKIIEYELKELKTEVFNLKETIKKIMNETNFFAKKEDVKVIEKYINLWNPLNFVTEEEVLELIKKGEKHGKRASH